MSVTTTKKFEVFQGTPIKDVALKDVPGVGDVALGKMKEANIDTAEKLIGQFLLNGRDEEKMSSWLEQVCEIRPQDTKKISQALGDKAKKVVEH
eukprot:CAMPEP_0184291580 /NCGR_PEP_ID=MMETSP1049-20130417/3558_1 /TAXON_ID=77928 /ORGANISM="Proteomonas sulcata, Strain CCMP704" /LENGTH=93 /DNA_ID=CAMNT_0026599065 /DNA_START=608 /DNA_END=889 /DNA_ORIENTATION=+